MLEVILSNPLSIDLIVEEMSLIGELKEANEHGELRFKLSLFTENENGPYLAKIPAQCSDFKARLGFLYDTLDEFKLIGYELTSNLKMKHEIMFAEISNPKTTTTDLSGSSSRLSSFRSVRSITGSILDLMPVAGTLYVSIYTVIYSA